MEQELLSHQEREIYDRALANKLPINSFLVERKIDNKVFRGDLNINDITNDDNIVDVFKYISHLTANAALKKIRKIKGIPFKDENIPFIIFHSNNQYNSVTKMEKYKEIVEMVKNSNLRVTFINKDTFKTAFQHWLKDLNRRFKEDKNIITQKETAIEELIEKDFDTLERSPITDIASGSKFSIQFNETVNFLPDIFKNIITSNKVPYVQYNDEKGSSIYKIYKSHSRETQPSYNVAIPESKFLGTKKIFLYIWKGLDGEDELKRVQEANKTGFSIATLSLNDNVLDVTITTAENNSLMVDRLYSALNDPSIIKPKSSEITKIDVISEVLFYDVNFLSPIFSEMIMNDKLLSPFFFLNENKHVSIPSVIHLRAQTGSIISVAHGQFTPEILFIGQSKWLTGDVRKVVDEKEHYLSINIFSNNIHSRDLYISTISKALSYYKDRFQDIYEEINRFVPGFERLLVKSNTIPDMNLSNAKSMYSVTLINGEYDMSYEQQPEKKQKTKKLTLNQKIAPEIFVSNYARIVAQRQTQPIIISKNEVEAWKRKLINGEEREVILFPQDSDLVNPNDPKKPLAHYYVCPLDESPYFERVVNELSNKDILKYHIRCGKKKTTKIRERKKHGTTILETFKIVNRGQIGKIDTTEASLISIYREPQAGRVVREGMFSSPNSFIHCLLTAFEPNYKNLSHGEAEERAIDIRRSIPQLINLAVVKQEQYDKTLEQIMKDVLDVDSFFDPEFWYRALEEVFDCNIYMFTRDKTDRDESTVTKLLVPKHKHVFIHRHRTDRPTVIILRHYGMEMNILNTPQCELIIDVNNKTRNVTNVFSNEGPEANVGINLSSALDYISKESSWDIENRKVLHRENIFSQIPYTKIFGKEFSNMTDFDDNIDTGITGQYIDGSGKARWLEIAPELNAAKTFFTDLRIYVNILPAQPLNVPLFDLKDMKLPSAKNVEDFLGVGDVTRDDGYLYNIGDVKDAIFVPFANSNKQITNVMFNIRKTKRNVIIIFQILNYLFLLTLKERISFFPSILSRKDFSILKNQNKNLLIPKEKENLEENYDLDNIPRILPRGSFKEVVEFLENKAPSLFSNGKIIVKTAKMLAGIKYSITKFRRNMKGIKIAINDYRVLDKYFDRPVMYSVQPEIENVLTSNKALDRWKMLNNVGVIKRGLNIQNTIQKILIRELKNKPQPYIYTENDKFYLVQSVSGGSRIAAMQVGYNWIRSRNNSGYLVNVTLTKEPNSVVYKIGQMGNLAIEDASRKGTRQYVEILNYGDNVYSALLRL